MSVLSAFVFGLSSLWATGQKHITFIHVIIAILMALFLSVSGDTIDFFIGKYATKLVEKFKWFQKTFSKEQLERGHQLVKKYGSGAIFISRYLPGVRTLTSYVAGSMMFPVFKFIFFNISANLMMLVICSFLGYFLGRLPFVQEHFIFIMVMAMIVLSIPTVIMMIKNHRKA